MRYDLTSLEIFVTVAETGTLTRAADLQHLAISAISKRISELEAMAGSPLLVRHSRGVSLTPAGQSLLHHARKLLQLVDHMHGELCEYAGGLKGVVRLHASTTALIEFLPRELQSFITHYPKVRLEIEERTGRAIVKDVAEGHADIGILGDQTPFEGLDSQPYHSDQLALAVPASHPLAQSSRVRFTEALDFDIVGPHADSSLWQIMHQAATAVQRPLEPRIQVSSFECMCLLVEAGLGIALLPERVLKARAPQGRLVILKLDEPWASRRLAIIFRSPLERLPLTTRALIDHLRSASDTHQSNASH